MPLADAPGNAGLAVGQWRIVAVERPQSSIAALPTGTGEGPSALKAPLDTSIPVIGTANMLTGTANTPAGAGLPSACLPLRSLCWPLPRPGAGTWKQ